MGTRPRCACISAGGSCTPWSLRSCRAGQIDRLSAITWTGPQGAVPPSNHACFITTLTNSPGTHTHTCTCTHKRDAHLADHLYKQLVPPRVVCELRVERCREQPTLAHGDDDRVTALRWLRWAVNMLHVHTQKWGDGPLLYWKYCDDDGPVTAQPRWVSITTTLRLEWQPSVAMNGSNCKS